MTRHEEIAARCEAATPGPWHKDVGDKPPMPHYHIRHEGAGWPIASMGNYHPRVSNGNWKNDMEFIVNAREDIPWLLSELARLTTEVTRLAIESIEREKQLAKLEAEVQHWADAEASGRMVALPESGIGDLSDGYHTFNELYSHRAVLFSVICSKFKGVAWKSKQHHDGTMYDGMFIVGINTPDGQATYHYDVDPYWDMFNVAELEQAPEWDGHTPAQAIERIATLAALEAAGKE